MPTTNPPPAYPTRLIRHEEKKNYPAIKTWGAVDATFWKPLHDPRTYFAKAKPEAPYQPPPGVPRPPSPFDWTAPIEDPNNPDWIRAAVNGQLAAKERELALARAKAQQQQQEAKNTTTTRKAPASASSAPPPQRGRPKRDARKRRRIDESSDDEEDELTLARGISPAAPSGTNSIKVGRLAPYEGVLDDFTVPPPTSRLADFSTQPATSSVRRKQKPRQATTDSDPQSAAPPTSTPRKKAKAASSAAASPSPTKNNVNWTDKMRAALLIMNDLHWGLPKQKLAFDVVFKEKLLACGFPDGIRPNSLSAQFHETRYDGSADVKGRDKRHQWVRPREIVDGEDGKELLAQLKSVAAEQRKKGN